MTGRMFTVPSGAEVEIDEQNFITTDVVLDLNTVIEHDFEGFLDLLSLGATDTEVLTEIEYTMTGITLDQNIVFNVHGNVSILLDEEDTNNG